MLYATCNVLHLLHFTSYFIYLLKANPKGHSQIALVTEKDLVVN